MRKTVITFVSILFICFSGIVKAQLTAAFTANVTVGCNPTIVTFTDLSTGPSTIISWQWLFGNGNSSFMQNPQATYITPGTKTVRLIVSDGTNTDTIIKANFITIFSNPTPAFVSTSGITGCAPYAVTFQDQSLSGDTTIVSWLWDFGDGDTSTSQHPTHLFESEGSFGISLQAVDALGCNTTIVVPNFIVVTEQLVANFPDTYNAKCYPPIGVNFSNTSTGDGTLSFEWDFGDGAVSALATPFHNYTSFGQFDVSLIVHTDNGCLDTLIRPSIVEILDPVANFTTTKGIYCKNEVITFTDTSVAANIFSWDFGDGSLLSTLQSPEHSYDTTGSYIVKLTVAVAGDTCTDVFSKTITIEDVTANFSVSSAYLCEVPESIQFTDLSTNAVAWEWQIGQDMVSNQQNPTAQFTLMDSLILLSYWRDYYNSLLTVTSANGCTSTKFVKDQIKIILPHLGYYVSEPEGCAPLDVNFYQLVQYVSDYDSVESYSWKFPDGSTVIGDSANYVFPVGTHNVVFSFETYFGCIQTDTIWIRTGDKPLAGFTVSDTISCASDTIFFVDTSINAEITEQYWQFEPSTIYWDHIGESYAITFRDTGYFDLLFITSANGCKDSLEVDSVVYIIGPVIVPDTNRSCSDPLTFTLKASFKGANRWYWDFGDGFVDSTYADSIDHTYPDRGNYVTTITAYNDTAGCTNVAYQNIDAKLLIADFVMDTTVGCSPNLLVHFDASSSWDVKSEFWWNWGDGNIDTIVETDTSHTFVSQGSYPVTLIVEDIHKCRQSTTKFVKLYKPISGFTSDTLIGCSPLTVNFIDTTITDTTITKWNWIFYDGTPIDTGNFSSHIYSDEGTYSVGLFVTDALGCTSFAAKPNYITISKPATGFSVIDSMICMGETTFFSASVSGNYLWDFGDAQTSVAENPAHYYADTGFYSVTLMAIDSLGCDSSLTKNAYIHVQEFPTASFAADTTYAECSPFLVKFYDSSASDYIVQWKWNFGDGVTSYYQNPSHFFPERGNYDVSLITTTSGGCTDTLVLTNYIVVKGPGATFEVFPDTVCFGEPVTFVIKDTVGISSFKWDVADGNIIQGTNDTLVYINENYGMLHAVVIIEDTTGLCTIQPDDSVFIHYVKSDFDMDDTAFCEDYQVAFTENSDSCQHWYWDFGDGSNDTTPNPVHSYPIPGNYIVQLVSSLDYGCSDTTKKPIQIVPIPLISISADTSICIGDTAFLVASGSENYFWSPSFGLNDPSIYNPFSYPISSITYNVTYLNVALTCPLSDSVSITVKQLPVIQTISDTSICQNDTIMIDAGAGFAVYQWSTSETSQTVSAYSDTTLWVRVQAFDDCWSQPDTVGISVYPLPLVTLGNDVSICDEDTLLISINSTYSAYLWKNGSTDNYVEVFQGDTVYVWVEDSNTCSNYSDSIVISIIPLPVVTLRTDTIICAEDSITIDGGEGYQSYFWSTDSTSQQIVVSSPGYYSLRVLSAEDCLSHADSVFLGNHPLPTVSLGPDTTICHEQTITFTSPAGYIKYVWQDGSSSQSFSITPDSLLSISLIVKDTNTCVSHPYSLWLGIVDLPIVDIGNDTSICYGATLTLNPGSGFISYLWNDGSTNQNLLLQSDDTASVSVTDTNNCTSHPDTLILLINPLPITYIGLDTTICQGDSLLFDGGSGYVIYSWSTGDSMQIIETSPQMNTQYLISVVDTNGCTSFPDTLSVVVHPYPLLTLPQDTAICKMDSISIDPGEYEDYQWSTGESVQIIWVQEADIFHLIALDTNGCWSKPDSMILNVNNLPNINLGNDTSICFGDSILVTPGAGFLSYNWSTGSTAQGLIFNDSDTISLFVVDSNLCSGNHDTLLIGIHLLPTLFIGNDTVICWGDSISLSAGSGFQSYAWSDSVDTESNVILPYQNGYIFCNVTDSNSCTSINDSIHYLVNPLPVIDLGIDTTICELDSLVILPESGYSTYQWSNGLSAASVTLFTTDTISLIVTDSNQCISRADTLVVTVDILPVVSLGNDTGICAGDTILLSIDQGFTTYLWSDGSNAQNMSIADSGIFWLQVKGQGDCWSLKDSISVQVNSLPVVTLGGDTIICYGDEVTLDAGTGFSGFLWSDGSETQTLPITPFFTQNISVRVKSDMECWGKEDTMRVTVTSLPQFNLLYDPFLCNNQWVELDVGSDHESYAWSTGDTTRILSINLSGEYIITVMDSNCYNRDTAIIENILLSTDMGPDTSLCDDESIILDVYTEGADYEWSTGENTPSITAWPGQQMIKVVISIETCSISDSIGILRCRYWPDYALDIPTAFSPNDDGINDVLNVLGYGFTEFRLMIFNRQGQLMFMTEDQNMGWDGTFEGKMQETEVYVYYLKATFLNGEEVTKKGNITLLN